jgi:hypothetical protein
MRHPARSLLPTHAHPHPPHTESLGVLSQASSLSVALEKPRKVRGRKAARGRHTQKKREKRRDEKTWARTSHPLPSPPPNTHTQPRAPRPPVQARPRSATPRTSQRLAAQPPKWMGVDVAACPHGRPPRLPPARAAPPAGLDAAGVAAWRAALSARRCASSTARGSIYDASLGLTCHFCRQKKLCGEAGCGRCGGGDAAAPCAGKSECWRCGGASGRFCRACLDVRYGTSLEEVRALNEAAAVAAAAAAREEAGGGTGTAGTARGAAQRKAPPGASPSPPPPPPPPPPLQGWLCPHCHEGETGGRDGWVCNSSICLSRRGVKPTGIAVFAARAAGHASVAHWLAARWAREGAAAGAQAVPAPRAADARAAGQGVTVPLARPASASAAGRRPRARSAGTAAAAGAPSSRPSSAKRPAAGGLARPRSAAGAAARQRPASAGGGRRRPGPVPGKARAARAAPAAPAAPPPLPPPPPPPPSSSRKRPAPFAPSGLLPPAHRRGRSAGVRFVCAAA